MQTRWILLLMKSIRLAALGTKTLSLAPVLCTKLSLKGVFLGDANKFTLCNSLLLSCLFFSCATQKSGVKSNHFLSGIFHKWWQGDRKHPSTHNSKILYPPKSIQAQIKQSGPCSNCLDTREICFHLYPRKSLITKVTIMSHIFVPDLRKIPEDALKPNYPQSPNQQLFLSMLSLC